MDREQFFNLDLEKEVLGILLKHPNSLDQTIGKITAEDLYSTENKNLFNAMEVLWNDGTIINPSTLYGLLKADISTVGGISYISNLILGVASKEGLSKQIDMLKAYTNRRNVFEIGKNITIGLETNKTTDEIITSVQERLNDFGYSEEDDGSIGGTLERVTCGIEERYNSKGTIKGISTGLRELDKKINGLNKKELIIVAGRPGSGKSTLGSNIAYNIVEGGGQATLFNLEMAKDQILEKMISNIGRIEFDKIRTGKLEDKDWTKYANAEKQLYSVASNLNIFDSVFKLNSIVAKARILHKKGKLGVMIVDYMQLIDSCKKTTSREQEVSHISRTLKQLSSELDTTIIALSQLSRAPEQRADHRPILSDLRESGSIEQDATTIIFCYRDEYYNAETEEKNIIELIIGKQRNGTTGTIKCVWMGDFQKVATLDVIYR